MPDDHFKIYPIGWVHKTDQKTFIEIKPQYQEGLLRLDTFSHIVVCYWFDQNDNPDKRGTMRVHPRKNPSNPLSGVFATHAPMRPNLIAITVCKLLAMDGTILTIDKIDAFDKSPVLDIKPLIPSGYDRSEVTVPDWV